MQDADYAQYVQELAGRVVALQVLVNVLATEFAAVNPDHLANVVRVVNMLGETDYGLESQTLSERSGYTETLTHFVERGTKTLTTKSGNGEHI